MIWGRGRCPSRFLMENVVPIYAYKCSACGHEQDVLQKMSDPLLTDCPECQQSTYVKQVTAAGFRLKGTGWYVTDFRDNNKPDGAKQTQQAAQAGSDSGSSPAAKPDAAAGTSGGTATSQA